MKDKLEKLYQGYLMDPAVREMSALHILIADEKFVKRSRQLEVMQNYILKTDTIIKKLMQLSIMTDINYKTYKKILEDNEQGHI